MFALAALCVSPLLPQAPLPYAGQPLPGREAVPFAPGFLNCGLPIRDIALAPDGTAIYVGMSLPGFRKAAIVETHLEGGRWTSPEVAAFSRDPRWRCLEPCISPDGRRFFFVSDRPADPAGDKPGPFGIWAMDREAAGWSVPRRLPEAVNGTADAFYPSITRDGVLYFLREAGREAWVMRSAWKDGAWTPAERLPAPFNTEARQANPRIDPDGRFLLLPIAGRPDSLGGADYYGYFRRDDGTWTGPVHLGPAVNSAAADEYSITPSPDGRVVFFGSNRALPRLEGKPLRFADLLAERTLPGNGHTTLWWVDAGFLEEARAKALAAPRN
ncbi:hypothetical protein [Geothrix sp. 21YS21S-4]|uniref:TolB family protein n=1 Tax=Geothrix sp. 21YS21S-4 TaxID=3068889 RepID=UPI0027B8A745|nr:hypothetical protein [Geothrix sp. 21YS21S-4]